MSSVVASYVAFDVDDVICYVALVDVVVDPTSIAGAVVVLDVVDYWCKSNNNNIHHLY